MLEKISMILAVPIVLCYIVSGTGLIREGFEDSELTGATKVVAEIESEEEDVKEIEDLKELSQMSTEELKALETDIEVKLEEVLEEELPIVELPERGDLGHNIPSTESAEQKIQMSDQETSIDLDKLAAERQVDMERTGAPISINSDVEPTTDGVLPGSQEDIQAKYVLLPMDQWMSPDYRPGNCFAPSIETWNENVLAY